MALNTILPTDPVAVRKQIKTLLDRGYRVVRCSVHQLKIGEISYYPGKGTIMVDPTTRHREKGFDALLDLLDSAKERTIVAPL